MRLLRRTTAGTSTGWRVVLATLGLLAIAAGGLGCGTGDPGDPGDPGPPGDEGPPGDPGPVVDDGFAAEGCLDCHGPGTVAPVVDVTDPSDVHYVDRDPDGPRTASGYRRLDAVIESVDLRGGVVELVFEVQSEVPEAVDDLFAADGRFSLARLQPPASPGQSNAWQTLLRSERFTTAGGVFTPLSGGRYRYRSAFDPSAAGISAGETIRAAIQLSAPDLPPANAVCDFDASDAAASDCTGTTTLTRDVVPTSQCNSCHGVTSETRLAFHGDARTEVEYCVVCHNPDVGDADMTVMTHKIHAGETLSGGYRSWSHVRYPRDLADCETCHGGGGADETAWAEVPTRDACGACHDDVDFASGAGHGSGGQQLDDGRCAVCHPADDDGSPVSLPVRVVHRGTERNLRASAYRGLGNGYAIEDLSFDAAADELTVLFSVTRDGEKLSLETAPEFSPSGGRGRVNLRLAWSASDYTNEGAHSGSPDDAPAQPLVYSGTDFDAVTNLGDDTYERVIPLPAAAFGTVTVTMEGYPATNLDGDAFDDALPVRSAFAHALVEPRSSLEPRRSSVDVALCNACHDAAGAGLSLHGSNRTSEIVACVVCHNADATDIAARPDDPADALDRKREESIDFKRLIHGIHAGRTLEQGLVVYGFGGDAYDASQVGFIGNLRNCETCHVDASPPDSAYGAEAASAALPSTLDTGDAIDRPDDDLHVSSIASVCSSCHDGRVARDHMVLFGASFMAPGGSE